jgi:glycosyltransferase involved in cell wall biosynthesis
LVSARSTVPTVSIGLPVYNGERFLRETLDSLLSQSFGDFELLISDNASNDATAAICDEYSRRDSRIKYFRQPRNIGLFPNVHFVMEKACGEFFMVVGDDDVYHRDYIATLMQLIETYPQVGLAYSNYAFISEDGVRKAAPELTMYAKPEHARFNNLLRFIPRRSCLPLMIGLFRTSVLRRVLPMPYQELAPMTGDVDNVFLVKTLAFARAASTPEVLFWYRLKNRTYSVPRDWPKAPIRQHWYIAKHNFKVACLIADAICRSDLNALRKAVLLIWNWSAVGYIMAAYLVRSAVAVSIRARDDSRIKAAS